MLNLLVERSRDENLIRKCTPRLRSGYKPRLRSGYTRLRSGYTRLRSGYTRLRSVDTRLRSGYSSWQRWGCNELQRFLIPSARGKHLFYICHFILPFFGSSISPFVHFIFHSSFPCFSHPALRAPLSTKRIEKSKN